MDLPAAPTQDHLSSPVQRVYLALGTNLGDRLGHLTYAIQALKPAVVPRRASSVYETPPWGVVEQPAFLNMALEAETALSPEELLVYLKQLEAQARRKPTIRNGPRTLDIDILFYGTEIVRLPQLQIPHPHMAGRGFVLKPLADLIPDFIHPVSGETISSMLERCDLSGIQPVALPLECFGPTPKFSGR